MHWQSTMDAKTEAPFDAMHPLMGTLAKTPAAGLIFQKTQATVFCYSVTVTPTLLSRGC
jgi:hypothetical protein